MKLLSYNALSGMAALLFIASSLVVGHKESQFIYDPQTPDPRTAHIHPLAIRGTGTVYLTPAESQSLAPYVYGEYAALALIVLVAGGRLAYDGHRGFMRGWRS